MMMTDLNLYNSGIDSFDSFLFPFHSTTTPVLSTKFESYPTFYYYHNHHPVVPVHDQQPPKNHPNERNWFEN